MSADGAQFPAIEISASTGGGAELSLSLTVGYEFADCLGGSCSADESNEILELPNPNLVEV